MFKGVDEITGKIEVYACVDSKYRLGCYECADLYRCINSGIYELTNGKKTLGKRIKESVAVGGVIKPGYKLKRNKNGYTGIISMERLNQILSMDVYKDYIIFHKSADINNMTRVSIRDVEYNHKFETAVDMDTGKVKGIAVSSNCEDIFKGYINDILRLRK